MSEPLEQRIQANVLEKIRAGGVRVHSKAYFVLRLIAALSVALLALALSAFVLSFILFSVHESGEQFLLGFGGRGVLVFLQLFPWLSLLLDLALLFLLEWLLRGFKIGYRVSLLTVFAGVFFMSAALALAVNLTPLHALLLGRADRGELPFGGDLYEQVHESHADRGIFRGRVVSVQENAIVIAHDDADRDEDDGTHVVMLPPGAPPIEVGERVYVLGDVRGTSTVEAQGIEVFPR